MDSETINLKILILSSGMQLTIPVLLGLTSVQRYDILCRNIGLKNVQVVDPEVDEDVSKADKSPAQYVEATAELKASAVAKKIGAGDYSFPLVVICADTVVSCDGSVCEKPPSTTDHLRMLLELRDAKDIAVYTAVCVLLLDHQGNEVVTVKRTGAVERTSLVFDGNVSNEEIVQYVASGDGSNAAGGFKVQLLGSALFERIEGDFFNVVGLPVLRTCGLLREITGKLR